MIAPIAVYDACVLYSSQLRNFLMHLATAGLVRARWSDEIHEEWMRSVERDFPDLTRAKLERTRRLMDAHVDQGLVVGHAPLIPTVVLPDPDDRHVLAAAIHAKASAIVTFNGKDFPPDALAPHGIEAITPDMLTMRLFAENESGVIEAVHAHRASLKNPPMTVEQYLAQPAFAELPRTTARLRSLANRI